MTARKSLDLQKPVEPRALSFYPEFVGFQSVNSSPATGNTARASIFRSKRVRKAAGVPVAIGMQTSSTDSSSRDSLPTNPSWFKMMDGLPFLPDELSADVAYWASYGHAQQDWSATFRSIITSMQGFPLLTYSPHRKALCDRAIVVMPGRQTSDHTGQGLSPPTNFLDIGCGIGLPKILEMANIWPDCHFTGLDIAPCLLPLDHLPPSVRERIHYVQGNFLERFPFDDAAFDFCLLSGLGLSIPEHLWNHVVEEATRVCSSSGHIEVAQANIRLGNQGAMDEVAEFRSKKVQTGQLDLSPDALVSMSLNLACDKRLLATLPAAHLKAALSLTSRIVAETPYVPIPTFRKLTPEIEEIMQSVDPTLGAVLQHAQAGALATLSPVAHLDLCETTNAHFNYKDTSNLFRAYKKQEQESANLARLVERELGWACNFDKTSLDKLVSNLFKLKRKAEDIKLLEQSMESSTWASATADIDRKIRDTEAEVKAAKKRLQPWTPTKAPLLELKAFVAVPHESRK